MPEDQTLNPTPRTWPGQGPNPGQRFAPNPSPAEPVGPEPTVEAQSLRSITIWPGKGPNIRQRQFPKQDPKVTSLAPTKLGNRATCPSWFDYDLSKQTLQSPGRAIMPTYDGQYQAGSLAGVYNWGKDPTFAGNKPQTGWIEGYVQKNGVNFAGAWVHLYHRQTGKQIASMRSNAQGYFKFDHLDPTKDNYFILAVDPNDEYNVVVFDRITP